MADKLAYEVGIVSPNLGGVGSGALFDRLKSPIQFLNPRVPEGGHRWLVKRTTSRAGTAGKRRFPMHHRTVACCITLDSNHCCGGEGRTGTSRIAKAAENKKFILKIGISGTVTLSTMQAATQDEGPEMPPAGMKSISLVAAKQPVPFSPLDSFVGLNKG